MLNHPFLRTKGEIPDTMPLSPSKNWSRMKFMEVFNARRLQVEELKVKPIQTNNEGPVQSPGPLALRVSSEPSKPLNFLKPYQPKNLKQATTPTYKRLNIKPLVTTTRKQSQVLSEKSPNIQNIKTVKKTWLPIISQRNGMLLQSPEGPSNEKVEIINWLEYPSHGVGYQLCNDHIGVLFNDATKMIMDLNQKTFDYIHKESDNEKEVTFRYSQTHPPKKLEKKFSILQKFKAFFNAGTPAENIEKDKKSTPPNLETKIESSSMIYVKKIIKTQDAVLFRLNNQTLQANFTDNTILNLNYSRQLITFTGVLGDKVVIQANRVAACDNEDVLKKLQLMQDILKQVKATESKSKENIEDKENKENQESQEQVV